MTLLSLLSGLIWTLQTYLNKVVTNQNTWRLLVIPEKSEVVIFFRNVPRLAYRMCIRAFCSLYLLLAVTVAASLPRLLLYKTYIRLVLTYVSLNFPSSEYSSLVWFEIRILSVIADQPRNSISATFPRLRIFFASAKIFSAPEFMFGLVSFD